jgi:hypothetical protein
VRGYASRQIHDFVVTPVSRLDPETKFVTVAIHEKEGKTILQPLLDGQEAKTIQKLFRDKTLEVWLSNGESDVSLFDVAIVKYKQVLQSLTRCSKIATQVCLKNLTETISCCEQCPLSVDGGEN